MAAEEKVLNEEKNESSKEAKESKKSKKTDKKTEAILLEKEKKNITL